MLRLRTLFHVENILGPKVKPESDDLTPEDTADEPSDKVPADAN